MVNSSPLLFMLLLSYARGISEKTIAKGLQLSKEVEPLEDGTFLVSGKGAKHIVSENSCDCKANRDYQKTCSHILAVRFFLERKEAEKLGLKEEF